MPALMIALLAAIAVLSWFPGASSSKRAPAPWLGLVLFEDGFNGAAGKAPSPDRWVVQQGVCPERTAYSCSRTANVFQNGGGQLVVRARREATGDPYSSGFLGTFKYHGWPPPDIRASWRVPFRIEVRALMPRSPGLWPVVWPMNVNRSTSEQKHELDVIEQRMAFPTVSGCYQHTWIGGTDIRPWSSRTSVSDSARNWHVYSADVMLDRVEYRVDGALCGTAPRVSGRFGILISNWVGKPGTWGSGGAQPATSDPGPWDLKIDYVRVLR